jgi:Holliday junction resolvase-like predicted endonuclease
MPSAANSLTKAIINYITLKGGYAVRINTQGQYDEKRGIWRKSHTRLGTSDVIACYRGQFVSVEVKVGKDRQSPEQVKTEQDVKRAGGLYWMVRTLDEFIELFENSHALRGR